MERNNITIETPFGKHKVVIKEWLTAREREALEKPMFDAMTVKSEKTGNVEVSDFQASLYHVQQHGMIDAWVESINDKKENVLDTCLNMHDDDFKFIIEKIGELSKKKSQNSQESTT